MNTFTGIFIILTVNSTLHTKTWILINCPPLRVVEFQEVIYVNNEKNYFNK